jgi:hypothetical protein
MIPAVTVSADVGDSKRKHLSLWRLAEFASLKRRWFRGILRKTSFHDRSTLCGAGEAKTTAVGTFVSWKCLDSGGVVW